MRSMPKWSIRVEAQADQKSARRTGVSICRPEGWDVEGVRMAKKRSRGTGFRTSCYFTNKQ